MEEVKKGRTEGREVADPLAEWGEELAVPADWETRPAHLQAEFEELERDGVRFFHHANGLFLLYLAPSHPLFAHAARDTARLVYPDNVLRCLTVTGKKRKGAPQTQPDTVVARIRLADGTEFAVRAGIKGFVVEVSPDMPREVLLQPLSPRACLAVLQPKSDFLSLASFKPQMLEEAKARRASKRAATSTVDVPTTTTTTGE